MRHLSKRGTGRPSIPTIRISTAEIRIVVDRWTCAQLLSQSVLNEYVNPVSRWSPSGIPDHCLRYPQPRIV
ncbi:hypothetical protein AYI69_g7375 [Smittium culicis]|uniref:Uncharacterized protein n=1 Tax=Smittium culicis TaxID=133412 RepID=A0A1R1XSG8_9FUNG|nr:hypothetical protein AYI69_g7375 [Smittium culicis]